MINLSQNSLKISQKNNRALVNPFVIELLKTRLVMTNYLALDLFLQSQLTIFIKKLTLSLEDNIRNKGRTSTVASIPIF